MRGRGNQGILARELRDSPSNSSCRNSKVKRGKINGRQCKERETVATGNPVWPFKLKKKSFGKPVSKEGPKDFGKSRE